MRRGIFAISVLFVLVLPVSAEMAFGPGAEGILYSGDGVAPLEALFGSALAISPGEELKEDALLYLEQGGRAYLQCCTLPQSLQGLRLTVQGDVPIFDGTLGGSSWIYLGNFAPGTKAHLTFTLTVPWDLSRQGRLDWEKLQWKLLAEAPQAPATGDLSHPAFALALGVISAAGLTAVLQKKRQLIGSQ